MRDELMVVDRDTNWYRDPGLPLKSSELRDDDWERLVQLGNQFNPESLLLTQTSGQDYYVSIEPVEGECQRSLLTFWCGILKRCLIEQDCRDTPERSEIALKCHGLSPRALDAHIKRVITMMNAQGKAGADFVGQAYEALREERRKKVAR